MRLPIVHPANPGFNYADDDAHHAVHALVRRHLRPVRFGHHLILPAPCDFTRIGQHLAAYPPHRIEHVPSPAITTYTDNFAGLSDAGNSGHDGGTGERRLTTENTENTEKGVFRAILNTLGTDHHLFFDLPVRHHRRESKNRWIARRCERSPTKLSVSVISVNSVVNPSFSVNDAVFVIFRRAGPAAVGQRPCAVHGKTPAAPLPRVRSSPSRLRPRALAPTRCASALQTGPASRCTRPAGSMTQPACARPVCAEPAPRTRRPLLSPRAKSELPHARVLASLPSAPPAQIRPIAAALPRRPAHSSRPPAAAAAGLAPSHHP